MQRGSRYRLLLLVGALLCALLASLPAEAQRSPWVGSWASSQMLVDSKDALPSPPSGDLTVRQLVRLTAGGSALRLTVSNVFGTEPLTILGVNVARAVSRDSSRIDAATDRSLTFNGLRRVIIPAGAEFVSDPVPFPSRALATLAVSLHVANLPANQTGHPGSRATSYFEPGDALSLVELRGASSTDHWYFLSGIDVVPDRPSNAIAVLGDSITDGHGVVSNTDTRWPDTLAERLKASPATRSLSVLNLGIGGNRLVDDGLGPNAVARFGRDVLERSGVRYLVILEGVNDLGVLTRDAPVSAEQHHLIVERILAAYAQMASRARERGIKVIGATILPFGSSAYYHPGSATEADRQLVNGWIRAPGNFDAVIDFDALMRDPAHPERMRRELDSDGLHPNSAGYRLMGEAVPLSSFEGKSGR